MSSLKRIRYDNKQTLKVRPHRMLHIFDIGIYSKIFIIPVVFNVYKRFFVSIKTLKKQFHLQLFQYTHVSNVEMDIVNETSLLILTLSSIVNIKNSNGGSGETNSSLHLHKSIRLYFFSYN